MARGAAATGPALVTAVLSLVWLLVDPPSIDIAAQEYRAQLFRDEGFVSRSFDWYGGFDVPGYSLLFPPLAAGLGARLLGVLAAVAATAVFALVAERYAGRNGRLAAYWFAIAIVAQLVNGRITFTLGVAVGLAAIWAIQEHRITSAALLGAATSAASPVAGLFVALAGAAVAIAGVAKERGWPQLTVGPATAGLAAAVGATAVGALMSLAWPTDGVEPFATSAFLAVPLFVAAGLLVVPRSMGALRWGLVLYGALVVVAFAVDNPLGSNSTRLGALFGGPVLALALWPAGGRARQAVLLLAIPLAYWQWTSAVDAVIRATPDPLREPQRSAPLLRRLEVATAGLPAGFRVHVPPTRTRWEAKHVAERFPIARGWLRQLESDDFELFTDGNLTPAAYRRWLADHDVALVAVPDATPDYLAKDERKLIASGLAYLRPIWSNSDWELFEVSGTGRRPAAG